MKVAKARIYWISENEGGRQKIPNSDSYSTVACFEDIKNIYPDEAWSIVVNLKKAHVEDRTTVAEIKFLVELAPEKLLYSGSKFELYEGKKIVAFGEIL